MQFGQAIEHQKQSGLPVEYDRKIRYLDYMENGQRSRGAGFVKLERRNNRCNISLQVNGLYRKDHFTRPLLLIANGEEIELCKLQMANGGIKTYLEGLDCRSMDGRGLAYERLTGLRIPISEGKEVLCLWETQTNRAESVDARRRQEQSEPAQNENMQGEPERDENMQSGSARDESLQGSVVRDGDVQRDLARDGSVQNEPSWNGNMQNVQPWDESVRSEPTPYQSMQGEMTWEESSQDRNVWDEPEQSLLQTQPTQNEYARTEYARAGEARRMPVHNGRAQNAERRENSKVQPETPMPEIQILDIQKPESRKQSASRKQEATVPFKEDKWEQLWAIYPHIHPFSDEREYLSFGLSDLVVLPARYYRLVNNSFLLHGFYNFHHLILTRLNGRNGARYFIGVPGNLYQTEKDTAIMFGFENFECDREPAGKGDFGYYLIQVEL